MKIVHVITGLGAGGAETMLVNLVRAQLMVGHDVTVVSLQDMGLHGRHIQALGVPVATLGMRRGRPDPRALFGLVKLLKAISPDLVQSWMYHADLLAGLAARLAGSIPVVWGIHHSDVDAKNVKRFTHWTRLLCARLSGVLPSRVVCGGEAVLRSHVELGYKADRMTMIPLGFDLDRFTANPESGSRLRRSLDIPERAHVVGLLARAHPDKDHRNFFKAASLVAQERTDVFFVLTGKDVEWSNPDMSQPIEENGIGDRVRLLGIVPNVLDVLSAIDVLALSSRTEAFPNVLGEAMACEVPCAATDCGDVRQIVSTTGRIVPPEDFRALAGAILELLALEQSVRGEMGRAARARVQSKYEIRAVAKRYTDLYAEVCDGTS